ncbi:MAG: hypothetical protein HY459_05020 [Parcubacteria group bacterium]|nr:hypothetical protein [Parcubacteria group bacterium]
MNIHLGFEVPSGEPKEIPIFHTVITGQTQYSGKSTTVKSMIEKYVAKGFSVLVFDTKETALDYGEVGVETPVVVRDTLDSLELLSLLESIMQTKLTRYYSILNEICLGGPHVNVNGKANSLQEIVDRAKYLDEHSRGFVQGAARTIWDLVIRLINQTKDLPTVTHLQLNEGINRMSINNLKPESQQIVVATALEDILTMYKRNVIVVLDEAFKFIPEGRGSACAWAVERYITQGAMTGLFLIISSQFLAITNKDPLKACPVKILGTQDHPTEVKHTLDLMSGVKLSKDSVMRLKIGHFAVATKESPDPVTVYVQPEWLPDDIAVKIARGEIPVKDAEQYRVKVVRQAPGKPIQPLPILQANNHQPQITELEKHIQTLNTDLDKERKVNHGLQQQVVWLKEEKEGALKMQDGLRKQLSEMEAKLTNMGTVDKAVATLVTDVVKEQVDKSKKEIMEAIHASGVGVEVARTEADLVVNVKRENVLAGESTLRGMVGLLVADGGLKEWSGARHVGKGLRDLGYSIGEKNPKIIDELLWFSRQKILDHRLQSDGSHQFKVRDRNRVKVNET